MNTIKFDKTKAETHIEKKGRGWVQTTTIPAHEGSLHLAIETSKDSTSSTYPRTIVMGFRKEGSMTTVAVGTDFYGLCERHTDVTRTTKAAVIRKHTEWTTPERLDEIISMVERHYAARSKS